MQDHIYFNGLRMMPAALAAAECDLHRDYVTRLAREGKIKGTLSGRIWYVSDVSLKEFVIRKAYTNEIRNKSLSLERSAAYQAANPRREQFTDDKNVGRGARRHSRLPDRKGSRSLVHRRRIKRRKHAQSVEVQPVTNGLHVLMNAPAGISHAAFHSTHGHSIVSPLMEFIHKIFALTFSVVITFGTFAFFNQESTRIAYDSFVETMEQFADRANSFARNALPQSKFSAGVGSLPVFEHDSMHNHIRLEGVSGTQSASVLTSLLEW